MNLTRNQFDLLTCLEKNGALTQRELAKQLNKALGTVNKGMAELLQLGFLKDGTITKKGLQALEPYRVKRAVFIAAGFGSRMVPITLNTPKPLVRVHGMRLIDTLLDAVLAAGIEEVYVVRGYLAEQFDQLLYKYPNIRFIENPVYNEANNLSSVMYARGLLGNAYVLEADLLLYHPQIITKYQYCSNYLGVPVKETDDWCFYSANHKYITKMSVGGTDCYHMFGISYWTQEDGARLSECVKNVYESPGGKERYWDQVPLEYHLKDFNVEIRECSFDDIIEIDTYNELKKLDPTYGEV
ncbi:NTP transferase domain-containing protein [Christensenella timonensis]|uniref:NTP transferase domain-containing protein n=1 Tax=Christensenella timonensis TaxID=1816678 RepID=UPI00082F6B1E|nr:NTP transferase domain-containing protein [Christensenella timonensis]